MGIRMEAAQVEPSHRIEGIGLSRILSSLSVLTGDYSGCNGLNSN